MSFRCLILAVSFASVAFAHALAADAVDHAIVPAFERFHGDADADGDAQIAGGRLLLGELNCLSCHKADAALKSHVLPKQAPILDHIGGRVRAEYLREFLADPQHVKPGTTMPSMFSGLDEKEKQQQVEALTHFLASTGRPSESGPQGSAIKRGEDLFHKVGCAACHNDRHKGAARLNTSVPLGDLAKKYSLPSLTQFLLDPLKVRPSGRMPHLNLNANEARDIASYLAKDLNIEMLPNVKFSYYEGDWDELPNFGELKPMATGIAPGFDATAGKRRDHFGMVFESLLKIDNAGDYTFHLGSDDGSRLLIDGKEVVNVDGIHPMTFRSGKVKLEAGIRTIVVEYFEQGGQEELKVEYEGQGISRQSLDYVVASTKEGLDRDRGFVVDEKLVEKGRRLFAEAGCASCHSMKSQGKPIASTLSARPLQELKAEGGCLGKTPPQSVPRFHLNGVQRAALASAIGSLRTPPEESLSAADVVHQKLAAFNCYSCHERDKLGGVETARNTLFQGNQPEMGDEGRIPPWLTGVGAKLRKDWMQHLLNNGAKDRPNMFTRMPRFGNHNVGDMADAFATADQLESPDPLSTTVPLRKLKAAGRLLSGAKGASCIKCHNFGKYKSTGIQSINLATMTRRLNKDWFMQYMLNPIDFRPGTRMPAAWPNGQTFFTDLLDGDTTQQINSVWVYLSDGDKAPIPAGLTGQAAELVVEDEAVIYRNFIEGSGPRAISVGYPEKANLSFDANNMRLAMLWHGPFMDAGRHWNGRGQGFQPPLGDNVLSLTPGAPLAVLAEDSTVWPSQAARDLGFRFRGYRLTKHRRPIFRYTMGNVAIEDFPTPSSGSEYPGLRRQLTMTAEQSVDKLYFRAARAASIIDEGNGWYSIDKDWKMRLKSGAQPEIRKLGNQFELLVPVMFQGGRAEIEQEFAW